jgi:hypothetical protein
MFQKYKIISDFKEKYREDWRKIAYNDIDEWNELLRVVSVITRDDKKAIDTEKLKIKQDQSKQELLAQEELRLNRLREQELFKEEQLKQQIEEERAKQKEIEKQRKAVEQEKRLREQEEIRRIEEENKAIVEKALREAKNDDEKNKATFLSFVAKMQEIEDKFSKDPNNIIALESALRKFQVVVNDYYSFKATLDKRELQRALNVWGINQDTLKQYEVRMAELVGQWEKTIEEKKAEKEVKKKEEEEKKKRVEKRKKEIEKIVNQIKNIDEEISPLYLTQYASDRDSMTSKERIKLYDKILKLYNIYSDIKNKQMSKYEYGYLLEKYPEWEIFKRIKDDYLGKETNAIRELQQLEKAAEEAAKAAAQVREYSKEEVDSWSFSKVKSFLREKGFLTSDGLIGPKKGVDPDDVRFAYNAHQRFVRKGEK